MMTCEQARTMLAQLPDSADDAALREHLQLCPECRAAAEFARQALRLQSLVEHTPELWEIRARMRRRNRIHMLYRLAALVMAGAVGVALWGMKTGREPVSENGVPELVLAWDGIESKLAELEAAIDADETAWKSQLTINNREEEL